MPDRSSELDKTGQDWTAAAAAAAALPIEKVLCSRTWTRLGGPLGEMGWGTLEAVGD
jgi:hypothetical protein